MIYLYDWLKDAKEKKAQELWLAPDKEPLVKVSKKWDSYSREKIKKNDLIESVFSVLSEKERRCLQDQKFLSGVLENEAQRYKYTFIENQNGVCASFQWIQAELLNQNYWDFPMFLAQTLAKNMGIHLITGPKQSGKTTALFYLLKILCEKQKSLVYFFSDYPIEMSLEVPGSSINFFHTSQLDKMSPYRFSADFVVIDSSEVKILPKALEMAQVGYRILMSLPGSDILSTIQKFSSFQNSQILLGIQNYLKVALGLKLLPSVEKTLIPAYELLFNNDQTRSYLNSQQYDLLYSLMRDSSERTYMRVLNQSLFQLLIKRKIELKVAFEESQYPEELDQMMKKVGF